MSSVHRRHQLWVHTANGSSGPVCRACSWFLFPCRGVRPGSLGPVPSSRSGGLLQALPLAWALGLPPPPHEDCAPASGPVQPSKGLGGARLAPEASILQTSAACREARAGVAGLSRRAGICFLPTARKELPVRGSCRTSRWGPHAVLQGPAAHTQGKAGPWPVVRVGVAECPFQSLGQSPSRSPGRGELGDPKDTSEVSPE